MKWMVKDIGIMDSVSIQQDIHAQCSRMHFIRWEDCSFSKVNLLSMLHFFSRVVKLKLSHWIFQNNNIASLRKNIIYVTVFIVSILRQTKDNSFGSFWRKLNSIMVKKLFVLGWEVIYLLHKKLKIQHAFKMHILLKLTASHMVYILRGHFDYIKSNFTSVW